ncbi:IS91 family transposase [Lacrimispora amygdalina]|uniref:IS91 family transposase n=1 Tax=Lacrimispora amygdalina TaxID=253257 RepID=UPI000BE465C1|nr:transposase [Lacrimispora amygdalina]
MNILQTIFADYYEHIIYELHPRRSVIENVGRMIDCGDPSKGGAMFGCPLCGDLKFVPFRCKSRFCPSCGNKYNQFRSLHMSSKLVSCVHRHCVFTIPEELRIFFLNDRSLLNCLFHSVRDVVLRMFFMMNKSELFTPGFICVLHTFGRDLKWNPHIHVLISEGGAGNFSPWRPVKHFNYNFLRIAFRKVLLEQLSKQLGPSFNKIKNSIYQKHEDGFYVRAKPNLCTPDITIKYISRYLGRPVIASSRIDHYDGDFVTFHYTRHEDNKTITERIPALDFIKRLIIHIPEKHFKMLRYYGIYAKHHKQEKKLRKCLSPEKKKFLLRYLDWRNSILLSFGYDPLCCQKCGSSMLVLEVYHKKTALFEQYRKVMGYG